jgi:hypothetical protein
MTCGVCDGTGWVTEDVPEAGNIQAKSYRCPICQIPSEPVS